MNPLILLLMANTLLELGSLFENTEEEAPDSEPLEPEYVPPFTGGQCAVQYRLNLRSTTVSNTGVTTVNNSVYPSLTGPIRGTFNRSRIPNSPTDSRFRGDAGVIGSNAQGQPVEVRLVDFLNSNTSSFNLEIVSVERVDTLNDDCGNTANPTPPTSTAESGLANAPYPDIVGDSDILVEGLAPLNLAAILAAIKAALEAATTIAELAAALADLLDAIDELLEEDEEDEDKEKDILNYNFGRISKDGFLRLFPNNDLSGLEVVSIDIVIFQKPVGMGKYLGNLSPHRYRYEELGYISFVSPSFGIIETHSIQFTRHTLLVPEQAIGFFYHFGLIGNIRAEASGVYKKKKEPEEPVEE